MFFRIAGTFLHLSALHAICKEESLVTFPSSKIWTHTWFFFCLRLCLYQWTSSSAAVFAQGGTFFCYNHPSCTFSQAWSEDTVLLWKDSDCNQPSSYLTNIYLSFLSPPHSLCHLIAPLIKPYSILPLCKVAVSGVPTHIPVSFPLPSLSIIEKYLDSKMYHKDIQYLIQSFNLIYHDIYVTLLSLSKDSEHLQISAQHIQILFMYR